MKGLLTKSLAGHDKDEIYIIIKEEGNTLYVANGANHKLENPKKKNKKHLQVIKKVPDEDIKNRIANGESVKNEEVKHLIKVYNKTVEE